MPSIRMTVPRASAVTIKTACTSRKAVGDDEPMSPDQARSSAQIATTNRGQTTQLKAPARMRNRDQFRVRVT